jgi:hypothetical protein
MKNLHFQFNVFKNETNTKQDVKFPKRLRCDLIFLLLFVQVDICKIRQRSPLLLFRRKRKEGCPDERQRSMAGVVCSLQNEIKNPEMGLHFNGIKPPSRQLSGPRKHPSYPCGQEEDYATRTGGISE